MQDEEAGNWLITVEGPSDQDKNYSARWMIGTAEGTRSEAVHQLWIHVLDFQPKRPWRVSRWWAYRNGDDYLARYEGSAGGHYLYQFQLARMVFSSEK